MLEPKLSVIDEMRTLTAEQAEFFTDKKALKKQQEAENVAKLVGYPHPPYAMTDDAIYKLVLRINLFGHPDDRQQLAFQAYIGKARVTELGNSQSHVGL